MTKSHNAAMFIGLVSAVAASAMATNASAEFVPPTQFATSPLIVNMHVGGQSVALDAANGSVAAGPGGKAFTSFGSVAGEGWSMGWDVLFDPDPFINASLQVVNESAVTQEFTLDFFMPISIDVATAFYHGDVTGAVSDLNGDGATLKTVSGHALYAAMLGDTVFHTLLEDPTLFYAPPAGGQGFGNYEFGDPEGGVAGPSLLTGDLIGIRLTFELTAGDSAEIDANFVVSQAPVPGPAAFPLLVLGALGLRGRRRR